MSLEQRALLAPDVLIVGAGPTGMVLALELARHGIAVRLIEKSSQRRAGSKGLSLNPASLRVLSELGVLSAVLRQGQPLYRATVVYRGRRLSALDFRRLHVENSHFVMLPQWQTEAILEDALRARGVRIEAGTELVGLDSHGDGAVATTSNPRGESETRAYRYVVGCDGAKSVVRTSASIPWVGRDYPIHMLLGDVRLSWDGPRDQGFYLVEDHGFVILLPLTEGYHRVIVSVHGALDTASELSFLALESAVHACVGARVRVFDPIWLSRAPFYNRLAGRFRAGPLFLAGDAAHLFSPIGGFGMNTGIGDAFNLGWKLARVLQGDTSEELLSTYESERGSLALRLIEANDRYTSLIARLDLHTPDDERLWLPAMNNRAFLRSLPLIASGLSSLDPVLLRESV